MNENLHPYVIFLPPKQKVRVLGAIFGSKAAVDILRFSLKQGISNRIYQKDLLKTLTYSNKTVIDNLKSLTRLGILIEKMEKSKKNGRVTWVKTYQPSNAGKWFALLLAKEKELSEREKVEIFQSLFRAYLGWAQDLSRKLNMDKRMLRKIFMEEMQ